jgi:hypothetical protein
VNLLSWILLKISLAEPKAKSKKMSPTYLVEEKLEAEVEAKRRSERKKKTLGRRHPMTSVIHTYYCIVLLSMMIFLIRWMTLVFQPSLA